MTSTELAIAAGGKAVLLTGMFGAPEREIALARPMAVAEIIAAHDLEFRLPTIAVLNGEPVLRGQWAVRYVGAADTIAFVAVPGGGGGGSNQGKQIMGLVAALALSVAAPFVGSFLAGSLGFAAGTMGFSIASSLASAAFLAGGALLLNMLMPPPTSTSSGGLAAADPVYSVNATSNQATPLERLPVLYGRLRFPPRHASRPYSEYVGNDQYLYQLFLVTAGKADIEKIEIGETEAWSAADGYSTSFSDLEFEIVQPGESITLFPANVVTAPEVSNQSVPNPSAVLGPFVVNSAGTTIDRIAVDFAFPGGLYSVSGSTVASNSIAIRAQYREIDNDGDPVGAGTWLNVFAQNISAATRTPQRMSRSKAVAAGRYEVRFLADEDFDPDDGASVNSVVWTGLRGYLTDFVTPANCTLLAMKIRANEQLSQFSSNQIRVIAERYLPVWNSEEEEWVEEKTRSIAWAAADLLMNSDYSVGLTTGQFDLAGLSTLAATWAGRSDTFNAIFDREWTVQDALRAILRAGRAQAVRMGGRIGFVRLEPKTIKRAVFTPRNVVRGSFQHKIVLFDEEKPDSVLGSYIDETTWQQEEVLASLASVGSDAPQSVEWFGITDHDQVWRESVTEAAVNAFAREFVSFTAEWEGKLLVRGEPILVQHPFIEGVEQASVVDRLMDVLTIDRDLEQEIVGDAYVIIRGKDGKEWGPCLVDTIDGRAITLNAADRASVVSGMGSLDDILPDGREERAHVLICDGEMRPFNGLVASASPNSSGKVEILAVIDAPEVYLADATEVMPSPWTPPVLPPQNPARPLVLGLYAELRAGTGQIELDAMWQPSPGAIGGYVAEISYDDDSLPEEEKTWTPIYRATANRFTEVVLPQKLVLRVAAIGVLQGGWSKRVFEIGDVPTLVFPGVADIQVTQLGQELQNAHGLVTGDSAGSIQTQLALLKQREQELALAVMDFNATAKETLNVLSVQKDGAVAAVIRNEKAIVEEGLARATAITQLTASIGNFIAGGFLRFDVEANELGSTASIMAKVKATAGSAFSQAAWMLKAQADGANGTDAFFGVLGTMHVFDAEDGSPIPVFSATADGIEFTNGIFAGTFQSKAKVGANPRFLFNGNTGFWTLGA